MADGDEEFLAGDGAGNGTVERGSGRKALRERLAAAGSRLDGPMTAELAGIEMAEREEKGQALFTAYLQNEVSEEYCNEAAGLLGYGLWWGEEARWRIAVVEGCKADPPAGLPCRIALECSLASGTGGDAARKPARIEMDVDGELRVHGFRFQWK
jgi:hypothetical protein